ncbi:MAG: hypothetical protein ACJ74T_02065, partial [Pyrinomonadaceae bacterium]
MSFDENEGAAGGAVLLKGARVVLPGEVLEGAAVEVKGGRITEVARDASRVHAGAAREIDLSGTT